MVLYRTIELKKGKDIIPNTVRIKSDERLIKVLGSAGDFVITVKHKTVFQTKKIPFVVSKFSVKFWESILERSHKVMETAKGKGIPTKRGSASFFLSSVSKYKDSLKRK